MSETTDIEQIDPEKLPEPADEKTSAFDENVSKVIPIEPVEEVIRRLYLDKVFYGYVLMKVKRRYTTSIPTAAVTIRRELLINIEFWNSCGKTGGLRQAICEHEVLHLGFLHFTRFYTQFKDPTLKDLANIATDCAINQLIPYFDKPIDPLICIKQECKGCQDFVKYEENGREKFKCKAKKHRFITFETLVLLTQNEKLERKQTAEYYFRELIKEKEKVEKNLQEMMNNGTFGQLIEDIRNGHDASIKGSEGEHKNGIDPVAESAMRNILYKAKQKQKIQDGKRAGTSPGDCLSNILPEYMNIDKNVWKRAINKSFGETPDAETEMVYNRPNRRRPDSLWGKKHLLVNDKVYVGVDTSGSISDQDLCKFFGVIIRALRSQNLVATIIQCDYEISKVMENVRNFSYKKDIEVKGRGGTDMTKIVKYIAAKEGGKKCRLVLLTDGETPWEVPPRNIDVTAIYTQEGHPVLEGIRYAAVMD